MPIDTIGAGCEDRSLSPDSIIAVFSAGMRPVVARSPDRARACDRRSPGVAGDLRSAKWHGQETVPQQRQETVPLRLQETVPQHVAGALGLCPGDSWTCAGR